MTENNLIELNHNSKMSDLSNYLIDRYGEKNNMNYVNEEKYSDEIINYMMYIDTDFKDKIIEKPK